MNIHMPRTKGNFISAVIGLALLVYVCVHLFVHAALGGHDLAYAALTVVGGVCLFIGLGTARDAIELLRSWRIK